MNRFLMAMRKSKQGQSGFTLIEILMAVLLIAILATIAISQFTNFARDSRNASTKENLGILRTAVAKMNGMMRIRCAINNNMYPHWNSINANDITSANGASESVCNTAQVDDPEDRKFVSGGIPQNPWSDSTCTDAEKRSVALNSSMSDLIGTSAGTPPHGSYGNCGWVYNGTSGQIKAATQNNAGDSDGLKEDAY